VTALAGVTAGHIVLAAHGSCRAPAYLLGWAGALALAAVAVSPILPAMRGLWTTTFALGAGSLGVVLLALVTAVLGLPLADRLRTLRERLAWPLVAMGRNSVPVYFGSELLMVVLVTRRDGDAHPWANVLGDRVEDLALGHNRTGVVALMLGLWLCVAALLHWRRIHLRP
jgi:predicted acyltransferase